MKNTLKLWLITVITVIGFAFIACEGAMGPQGEQGETLTPDIADVVYLNLEAGDVDFTLALGEYKTIIPQINSGAFLPALTWEIYDEASSGIIQITRTTSPSGVTGVPMIIGNSVTVTGIADGEARLVVTTMGGGTLQLRSNITVTVRGLTSYLNELPDRVTGATLPVTFEFNVSGDEFISPQVFDFPELDAAGTAEVTIIIRGTPGVTPGVTLFLYRPYSMFLEGPGSMFVVGNGVKLVLEDLILRGVAENNRPLLLVDTGGELEITRTTITGNVNNLSDTVANTPLTGGGVHIRDGASFTMHSGGITNNATLGMGGGVMINLGASFEMSNGVISGNFAGGGGGVFNRNSFVKHNGLISHNSTSGPGGGIHNQDAATFEMFDGEISNNHASGTGGGGVSLTSGSSFTMHNGRILDNSANLPASGAAGNSGGGVRIVNLSTFIMHDGEISGNLAHLGGGVFVDTACTFVMFKGLISNNSSCMIGGRGGGVAILATGTAPDTTFTMHDGTISNNTSPTGGGVQIVASSAAGRAIFTMYEGVISGNTASNQGGGVQINFNSPGAIFNMYDGLIYGNFSTNAAATHGGGGVMLAGGTFNMHDGKISGNEVAASGGGVRINAGAQFNMHNGTIAGNTAAASGGGVALAGNTGIFRMVNGIIYGNEAILAEGLENSAATGAAFAITVALTGIGMAQHGTFAVAGDSASTWTGNHLLPTGNAIGNTDDTIEVDDGDLVD